MFHRCSQASPIALAVLASSLALALGGCGSATTLTETTTTGGTIPKARPGDRADGGGAGRAVTPQDPVGDPTLTPRRCRRSSTSCARSIAAPVTNATYIDPLQYVTAGSAPIREWTPRCRSARRSWRPAPVKILAIIPDWYAGQPLVYFELLDGPDAGKVQYVAEQITDIARPARSSSRVSRSRAIASSGTAIEYGWSTLNGITLARATTGYEEGQVTPAGVDMRNWLNAWAPTPARADHATTAPTRLNAYRRSSRVLVGGLDPRDTA